MLDEEPRVGALVLYHQQAAVVDQVGQKFEVTLANGSKKSLRRKDIILLDPGPVKSLSSILTAQPPANVEEAWQLLEEVGQRNCDLLELSKLIYGTNNPETVWACYRLLNDTPYFKGAPPEITIRSKEEVEAELRAKRQRQQQEELWKGLLIRLQQGQLTADDRQHFQDVERLAQGEERKPVAFRLLGLSSTPEDAHHFLLKYKLWDAYHNPYPARAKLDTTPLHGNFQIPCENRRDLTHLNSWAIDDETSTDPDDAISLEGQFLWAHIADAAAVIPPESEMDLIAKERGSTLYLPEGNSPMLPTTLVDLFGLGLQPVSPALSFKILVTPEDCQLVEYCPSWVAVKRLSYHQADVQLPLSDTCGQRFREMAQSFQEWRKRNGAVQFQFPEVNIKLQGRTVLVQLAVLGESRRLISEAMVLCGYAVAKFCQKNKIPVPYLQQSSPAEPLETIENLRQAFAARKKMNASVTKVSPGAHFGLGLPCYTRTTSPLRRYLDLVVHQQLRLHLAGQRLLSETQILERIASAEVANGRLRQVMRNSHRHWLLVYLQQQRPREWSATLLERRERRGIFFVHELGLEITIPLKTPQSSSCEEEVTLLCDGVDLPRGEALFKYRS